MVRRHVALMLASTVLLPITAAAQDACGIAANPRAAGSFVEYNLTGPNGTGTMRMAALGTETHGGNAHERIELQMTGVRMGPGGGGGPLVLQVLVPRWPFDLEQVSEIIVQGGGRPPMKMPAQMMGMMRQRANVAAFDVQRSCARAKLVGEETITVPGGTLKAKHYRNEDDKADVWIGDAAAGFGLLKAVSASGTLEFVKAGTGATSSLSGPVMEMPMMGPPPGAGRP